VRLAVLPTATVRPAIVEIEPAAARSHDDNDDRNDDDDDLRSSFFLSGLLLLVGGRGPRISRAARCPPGPPASARVMGRETPPLEESRTGPLLHTQTSNNAPVERKHTIFR
jgi:hypothetical protein